MEVSYPRLIKRVRAALIDSVVLVIALFASFAMMHVLDISQSYAKILMILAPVFILEPGLVAFTGGTIGHHLMKLRVTKSNGTGNINIVLSVIRFITKFVLGWISFIFVLTSTRHQAAHDFFARSVVILKSPAGLPVYDVLSERKPADTEYLYPAPLLRALVIAAYWVLATAMLVLCTYVTSSEPCVRNNRCSGAEFLLHNALGIIWLVALGWITVKGWRGGLFGCRKKPRPEATPASQ